MVFGIKPPRAYANTMRSLDRLYGSRPMVYTIRGFEGTIRNERVCSEGLPPVI